jgi:transcriptional regulator with XRE-family HTH domain
MHALRVTSQHSSGGAASLLGISAQALSELQSGRRSPSLTTAHAIALFFEVPLDRLLEADFSDLLSHELADPDRYQRVENKIAGGRRSPRRRPKQGE